MDTSEKFFEREIDRTPYSAFGYLGVVVLLIFVAGGFALSKVNTYVKDHNWGTLGSTSGATDALLNNANAAADAALTPAQAAVKDAEKQAADAAQAAATQALLNQKDAVIKDVTDSAHAAMQSAAPSAAASAATSGQEQFQKYLGQ